MEKVIRRGRQTIFFSGKPIINKISEKVLTKMREKDYNIAFKQVKPYSCFIIVFDCKKWEKLELQLISKEAIRDLFAAITEAVKELRV